MALATPNDVRQKIGWAGDDLEDDEITDILDEMNRDMDGLVDYPFVQRETVEDPDDGQFKSTFRKLEKLGRVFHNGDEVDSNDYSKTDASDDTSITIFEFDSSYDLSKGDKLEFWIYPTIFKDIEVALAVQHICENKLVSANDDVLQAQSERFEKRANKKIAQVNRHVAPRSAPDNNRGRKGRR